ncbi:MAG: LicD family protein [Clostridia bacterium]|nr:LicD family protein [Clostridia bacterium]
MMDAATLRMLQLEELDMAKQILAICEKHDIEVFALGGTLLGAVRHQGFIPWDDDLDLGMKRADYERFIKLAPSELHAPLSLHTCYNDKAFLYPYVRVQNADYGLQRDFTTDKTVQDLWVDIFPLDGVPADGLRRMLWEKALTALRGLRNLSAFNALVNVEKSYSGLKGAVFEVGEGPASRSSFPRTSF